MNVSLKHKASKIKVELWIKKATSLLKKSGVESAQLDAELILCDTLNVSREWLIAHRDIEILKDTAKEVLERRLNREPLPYIRGFKEFYGRDFRVNKDVLIPRPESEIVITILKEIIQDKQKIIDVGTGSGALAITAALDIPLAQVSASDSSKKALNIATKNAKNLGANVTFIESNLLTGINEVHDVIVANLPYVDESWNRSPETDFEPSLALFAKDNGLELIKKLIVQSQEKLQKNGFLLLEADPRQHQAIIEFAEGYGFSLFKKQDFVIVLEK